ncbi:MAG: hypothetical protein Q9170_005740 [Blastenia crenularia]
MASDIGVLEIDLVTHIFSKAPVDPNKPVLIDAHDPSRFLTFNTARTTVRKLIAGFQAQGLEKGDCVCINAFNDIYYPIVMLAIIGAGGRFTGSNPSYTSFELNHHIRVSHAKFLVAEPPTLATTLQSAKDCEIPESKVFTFETKDQAVVPGQRSWTDLLKHGEADWLTFDKPGQAKSIISTLAFTSGTTGFPKAAMIPHLYAISQLNALENQKPPHEVTRSYSAESGTVTEKRIGVAITSNITEIPMVPTMLVAVLNSALTKEEDLKSLRSVWIGGSPLRSSTQKAFQALLDPDALVTQVWGMTETGWTTLLFWPESDDTGSVGRLLPGMSSKLIADDGSIITEDNREGELFVRGASIMNGYFNDPAATAATIDEDGWLRTGDVAYCIKGKWYIVDRKKDMIKFHGWQVAPAELEAVLLTHPQVVNAAVIGIPLQDGTGEMPQAFIVLKPKPLDGTYASHGELEERTTTEEELKTYLSSRLAKYKALNGVTFVEDIPRTVSGKLQKFKLKELYLDLSKTKKRKVDELETIADRNAAISDGTSDPTAIRVVEPSLTSSREAKQSGRVQSPRHEDEPTRKRVKAGNDLREAEPSSNKDKIVTNGRHETADEIPTGVKTGVAPNGEKTLGNGHAGKIDESSSGDDQIVTNGSDRLDDGPAIPAHGVL